MELLVAWLESMPLRPAEGGEEPGLQDVDLTYTVGEAGGLWEDVFLPLKLKAKAEAG